jgi:hypothetical protein
MKSIATRAFSQKSMWTLKQQVASEKSGTLCRKCRENLYFGVIDPCQSRRSAAATSFLPTRYQHRAQRKEICRAERSPKMCLASMMSHPTFLREILEQ